MLKNIIGEHKKWKNFRKIDQTMILENNEYHTYFGKRYTHFAGCFKTKITKINKR